MRKLTVALLLLLTVVAVACSQEGVPANPAAPSAALASPSGLAVRPSSDIAVTTTIRGDVREPGVTDDISSDGGGPYPHNVNGVKSILTANGYNGIQHGDWQFDTLNSTVRKVGHSFDLQDAVKLGDFPQFPWVEAEPPFWGTQALKQKNLAVKCTLLNQNMLTMTAGKSFTCPLLNGFIMANGTEYGLHPAKSFTGFPETTDVQIVCNSADLGGCKEWVIDPIGGGQAVARLTLKSSKPNGPSTNKGAFYLRFRIHLTRS